MSPTFKEINSFLDSFFFSLEEIDENELRNSSDAKGKSKKRKVSQINVNEGIENVDFENFVHLDDFDFEADSVKERSGKCQLKKINAATDSDLLLKKISISSSKENLEKEAENLNTWLQFGLHPKLARSLVVSNGFIEPTEIQRKTLKYTIPSGTKKENKKKRDIIAASETVKCHCLF